MDLSQKLLETGMVVRVRETEAQPTQVLAVWDDLLNLAVLTTENRRSVPFEVRRREMEQRFVRDPNSPKYPLIVEAGITAKKVTELPGIGFAYEAEIQVPDDKDEKHTVSAVPHILVNGCGGIIPYGKPGEISTHQCFVIKPLKSNQPHRLVPLGLASASRLDLWNRLVDLRPDQNLERIEPIHHNLFADEGVRYIMYTPPGMWKIEGQQDLRESAAGYHFGHICGQSARLLKRGSYPSYDDKEVHAFSQPLVFLMELGERSIGLKYVGRHGDVELLHDTIDLGKPLDIDPFVALGISPMTADLSVQSRRAYDLAAGGEFAVTNPLYTYAVQIGLVDPVRVDDVQLVRSSLNRLAFIVVAALRKQLDDIKYRIVSKLTIYRLPDSEAILGGKSAGEVWHCNSGKDAMVDWLDARINGKFDWNSWLHREVRTELLKRVGKDQFPPSRRTSVPLRQ